MVGDFLATPRNPSWLPSDGGGGQSRQTTTTVDLLENPPPFYAWRHISARGEGGGGGFSRFWDDTGAGPGLASPGWAGPGPGEIVAGRAYQNEQFSTGFIRFLANWSTQWTWLSFDKVLLGGWEAFWHFGGFWHRALGIWTMF